MQTPFIAFQVLYNNNKLEEDIAYRMVADIAYSFWEDKSWVLIMISVFLPVLKRWMPILMSFMDGGLMEYYRIYFITTFQTIAT